MFKLFQNSLHRSFQVGRCVCFDIILIKGFFEKVIQYFRSENVTYNGFTKGFMKYFCNIFYSLYRSMLSPCFPYFGCHFNIYIFNSGEAFIWPATYYNNDSSYVNIYSLGSLDFICIYSLPN